MPQRSQTFDSAGPDVRIRGNAYQVLEKYLAMARDASAAGDRIAAENFYQHAEHYYRVISANGEHDRQQQQHNQISSNTTSTSSIRSTVSRRATASKASPGPAGARSARRAAL